jgi:hypothetical protein
MNYQVVVPPILLLAGLGEMCRIGDVVLNPFLGPRFKAAVVTTDLPLAADKPIDNLKWWLDLERVNGDLQVPRRSKSNQLFIEPEH